ncbi:MAG: sigma-70 family RNA polymerase sigma factor [Eubacteriales bacterium]|nr:sigma-70 family RNA polymerase sigma factor [Eubacteriales bacterium]
MAIEDDDIIELLFDREQNALEFISQKYNNYCTAIANNILNNKEDVEECVNDTYLKIWNSIPPNRPEVLRTFIGRITRNQAFDLYKKMNAQKRGKGQIAMVLDELEECIAGDNNPEKILDQKQLLEAINSFLGTLSKEKCALFVRRYWYSDNIAEIASRYGMSENHVSVSLNRLRKKLRAYLIERGFEL